MSGEVEKVNGTSLSIAERESYKAEVFRLYSEKALSMAEISRRTGISRELVKRLLDEAAAWERANRPDTKTAAEAGYRSFLSHCLEVVNNPEGHPALVVAKAYEGVISAMTRLDKLGGHEQPTMSVGVSGKTAADLIKQYVDENGGISAADLAQVGIDDNELTYTLGEEDIDDVR